VIYERPDAAGVDESAHVSADAAYAIISPRQDGADEPGFTSTGKGSMKPAVEGRS